MIQSFHTNEASVLISDTKLVIGGWINVCDPTEEEVDQLIAEFKFPRDYITSVLDLNEVSRQEMLKEEDSNAPSLIVLQYPLLRVSELGYKEYTTFPISIILTEHTIITATKYIPHFITEIIDNHPNYVVDTTHQERFVLRMLWHISASYMYCLDEINAETRRLELLLTKSTKNEQLYALMSLQKSLIYFSTAIGSNKPVFEIMKETDRFSKDLLTRGFLHDVIVENNQANVMTSEYQQVLNQVSLVFSSVISNNLNNIMKILTSITIVLTIPTILGGIYGMNVDLPFMDTAGAFWLILGIMAIASIITAWILKKKNFF
ncbi:magnesium transporter CorA family protein [Carnobacterium gallinarum]|uniref:magnesium transporter CorA family protein n=1 Tax=Carnobacterium gallinarum TaxID=2749 RepID=UPI00054D8FCA|nr:magnesium transporter CorA family protein [Carnobacterium gallinarum]